MSRWLYLLEEVVWIRWIGIKSGIIQPAADLCPLVTSLKKILKS